MTLDACFPRSEAVRVRSPLRAPAEVAKLANAHGSDPCFCRFESCLRYQALVAQLDRAGGFYPPGCRFEPCRESQPPKLNGTATASYAVSCGFDSRRGFHASGSPPTKGN